jgi:Na+/phosphate symporter
MKDKNVFFNPFRLISPTLDSEASRIEELYETAPADVTCLEEGLLVMCSKLIEMTDCVQKSLIVSDSARMGRCAILGKEIHDEEKGLTGDLVCYPDTKGDVLKAIVLFPGRLERVGDLLESILNVSRIKARDGVPFSDKALNELSEMFSLFAETLKTFRDVLLNRNKTVLEHLLTQQKKLAQMTLDFGLAHEDRLLQGLCSPKSSSLYLDILDSIKSANAHIREMSESLLRIANSPEPGLTN